MKKKLMTIEDLGVKFDRLDTKVEVLAVKIDGMAKVMATKDDLKREIENLAGITTKGFTQVYKDMSSLKIELKQDMEDMGDRLGYRWSNEFDRMRDDMRLVKTKLGIR